MVMSVVNYLDVLMYLLRCMMVYKCYIWNCKKNKRFICYIVFMSNKSYYDNKISFMELLKNICSEIDLV